jgi:hypothetical protein
MAPMKAGRGIDCPRRGELYLRQGWKPNGRNLGCGSRQPGAEGGRPNKYWLITREIPRLCRGGSRSLTVPAIGAPRSTDEVRTQPPSTRTKFRRWTGGRASEQYQGLIQRRILNLPCDMGNGSFVGGRGPPSGGSPIGAAQRPRCRFERPQS